SSPLTFDDAGNCARRPPASLAQVFVIICLTAFAARISLWRFSCRSKNGAPDRRLRGPPPMVWSPEPLRPSGPQPAPARPDIWADFGAGPSLEVFQTPPSR